MYGKDITNTMKKCRQQKSILLFKHLKNQPSIPKAGFVIWINQRRFFDRQYLNQHFQLTGIIMSHAMHSHYRKHESISAGKKKCIEIRRHGQGFQECQE